MSTFGNQDNNDKKSAKAGIDLEKGARRRAQQGVKMRSNARDEMLKRKRRGETEDFSTSAAKPSAADRMNVFAYGPKSRPSDIPQALLQDFVQLCHSDDMNHLVHGAQMIRKLLSVEDDPPIEQVVATNVSTRLVEFLSCTQNSVLQFEAAWALTNVASGLPEHTNYVMGINACPALKDLLFSEDDNCREQATWALGNLAGDNARCRDYILSLGVIQPLLSILNNNSESLGVHRNAVWSLANLCRGRPAPDLDIVGNCIPMFCALLNSDDEEMVMDAAWGISYLAEGGFDRMQKIMQINPLQRLVNLCNSTNSSLISPAMRTIGAAVTGSDSQTQLVVNAGALHVFKQLLNHTKRGIRKEVCWALSNILAGTEHQVDSCIDHDLLVPLMNQMFCQEYEVRKEAVWAIANFTAGATDQQIGYLVSVGGLDNICDLLQNSSDMRLLAVLLEACDGILRPAEVYKVANSQQYNHCAMQMIKNGGLRAVERLQMHSNVQVADRSGKILERYFDLEDEQEDGNPCSPTNQNGGHFEGNGNSNGNTNYNL